MTAQAMHQRNGFLGLLLVAPVLACASAKSRPSPAPRQCDISPDEVSTEHPGESWVKIQYDVTPAGDVVNATVIQSCPPGVFDDWMLRMMSKMKLSGHGRVVKGVVVTLKPKSCSCAQFLSPDAWPINPKQPAIPVPQPSN
jgi:hypothetical protein